MWAVAAPAYAISNRGIDAKGALWAGVVANVIFLITMPLWGMLSDRIGRRPVFLVGLVGLAVSLFPLNAAIGSSAVRLTISMSVALVFMGACVAIAPAIYAEMFPTSIRAVGLGVPYSIAVAVFGGTAPYLQQFFANQGRPAAFNWYAVGLAVISIITIASMPETKGRDLADEDHFVKVTTVPSESV